MNSKFLPKTAKQRFAIALLVVVVFLVGVAVAVDASLRGQANVLNQEMARITSKVGVNSETRQLSSTSGVNGLLDRIQDCVSSGGTRCYAFEERRLAVTMTEGAEGQFMESIAKELGYSRVSGADCDLKKLSICGAGASKGDFRLTMYVRPEPTISDVAPEGTVWRNVSLRLTQQ
jgi:hypothetical protein